MAVRQRKKTRTSKRAAIAKAGASVAAGQAVRKLGIGQSVKSKALALGKTALSAAKRNPVAAAAVIGASALGATALMRGGKGGTGSRRRMNPMNARAARRAAARLKSSVKLLRNIEKLAHKAVPQPRRSTRSSTGSITAKEAIAALSR